MKRVVLLSLVVMFLSAPNLITAFTAPGGLFAPGMGETVFKTVVIIAMVVIVFNLAVKLTAMLLRGILGVITAPFRRAPMDTPTDENAPVVTANRDYGYDPFYDPYLEM